MRLTRATPQAIRYACLNFHYAKAVPVNVVGYNVYNINDEWCGCILYGSGANNDIGTQFHLPQGGGTGACSRCAQRQAGMHNASRCDVAEATA